MKNAIVKIFGMICAMTVSNSAIAKPLSPENEVIEVRAIIGKVNTYWQKNNAAEVNPFWTDAPLAWTSQKAWDGKPFPKDHRWEDSGKIKDLW